MTPDQVATIAAYDQDAAAYREATRGRSAALVVSMDEFASRLPPGGPVLEIGSGPGHDAVALEARGIVVRRTDVTPAFVELMRAAGHEADVLDPLNDELGGTYAGVWASAVLLHVERDDTPVVLARLAAATTPAGVLHLSLKEGDGAGWSTHGSIRAARRFTYWREKPLRVVLEDAGWTVESLRRHESNGTPWLDLLAVRRSA